MAQSDLSKEEAKKTSDAVEEMFEALPKAKQGEYLGHLNDILLFLGACQRDLPSKP